MAHPAGDPRSESGLPDIQGLRPQVQMKLSRVGIAGVKKLVELSRTGAKRPVVLVSTFDLYVDLPAALKGANLSRNMEVMNEVLEEAVRDPRYESPCDLCEEVAGRLLERHEYADRAEVRMRAEYMVRRKTPVTGIPCQGMVDVFARAVQDRRDRGRKMLGAEVVGMTACPCAQEMVREHAADALRKHGIPAATASKVVEILPAATHNQRGRGSIAVEVSNGVRVPLDPLISIIARSMSMEIFELLKRPDEAHVVEEAHRRPMFVEDCVREMARRLVAEMRELPDTALVTIKQTNEESIHQHDAFAERVATLGELRKELNGKSSGR
ncbi:MAG: GTP cyclohydrolase MptA [Halobacteria archaeon]